MKAVRISETSITIYQTSRRNTPEDSHFRARRHENLNLTECNVVHKLASWVPEPEATSSNSTWVAFSCESAVLNVGEIIFEVITANIIYYR
jgi:hypothetical protein